MLRFGLVGLLLVVGAGSSRAQPPGASRPLASLRACQGIAECTDAQRKLYEDAFAADEPVIELVTMGVGDLIWQRHGHIALCVRWPDPRRDRCYNYGVSNFGEPLAMTWGFFRAARNFWVEEEPIRKLMETYVFYDRSVWAQPIPLAKDKKDAVIAKLQSDLRIENRYYSYDHFWDNCTTRVRDILDDATGKALSTMDEPTDGRTFRDLAREGFVGMRVPLLVTDIAMGRVTDRVPTYWERMFLPDYLREAVHTRFGVAPIVLYQRVGPPPPKDGPSGRVIFALVILALTAPAWLTRLFGRFQRLGMWIAVVPPVLLGTVLWFLAIISPLPYVELNESCLVFWPLDLMLVVLPPTKRRLYARARVVMLIAMSLLLAVGVLTQPLFAPLLWPLIPAAVVGFWPERWTRGSDAAAETARRAAA